MTMNDLTGQRVKISAGTITVKDNQNKTRGMVRGIRKFQDAPKAKQFDCFSLLRKSGIWENGFSDCVIYDGAAWYYLNDLKPIENYNRLRSVFESDPETYGNETKRNAKRIEVAEKAKQYMTVINCYILH